MGHISDFHNSVKQHLTSKQCPIWDHAQADVLKAEHQVQWYGSEASLQQTLGKQPSEQAVHACDPQEDGSPGARLARREWMEREGGRRGSKGKEERERERDKEPVLCSIKESINSWLTKVTVNYPFLSQLTTGHVSQIFFTDFNPNSTLHGLKAKSRHQSQLSSIKTDMKEIYKILKATW